MQYSCIHVYQMVKCERPAFDKRTHGWLCAGHYRQQQESIPAKPRQAQPKWKGFVPVFQSDEAIIADIIQTEKRVIGSGRVTEVKCGVIDPIRLRVFVKQTVH